MLCSAAGQSRADLKHAAPPRASYLLALLLLAIEVLNSHAMKDTLTKTDQWHLGAQIVVRSKTLFGLLVLVVFSPTV